MGHNQGNTSRNWLALIGLIIALLAFIFGDNIYERITGRPIFGTSPQSTTQPTTSMPQTAILLSADYQNGNVHGSVLSGNWHTADDGTGNQVLEVQSTVNQSWSELDMGSQAWRDYIIDFRFKLIEYDLTGSSGSGTVVLVFRHDEPNGAYVLTLNAISGLVELNSGVPAWIPIKGGMNGVIFDFGRNIWHSVRVEANGSRISASIDGKLVASVQDSRAKQGPISLGVFADTHAQFDDLQVTSIRQ